MNTNVNFKLTLASLLLGALVAVGHAELFGRVLERKYPDKFDYQGIVDFYLKNDLTMVHFGHLNDFIQAITNLRDQHNSGQFTRFGHEQKYRKLLDNVDDIIEFGRVVRSSQSLCTTEHIDELMNLYRDVILSKPFMLKYFANNFRQYVKELGRLCKAKVLKIHALFDGGSIDQQVSSASLDGEERANLMKVREASSLLCNFVTGQPAGKLCFWNEASLSNFKVEKLEDLDLYLESILTFYTSLANNNEKSAGVATTNIVDSQWLVESLNQSPITEDAASLPVQPLHAACELLENVYEQSTAPVDILGHNNIYSTEEHAQWSSDWNNKKWLHIERVCSMIMRTSIEFDKSHNEAYPIFYGERSLPKPARELKPFTGAQTEEQIFQIDFTKTYKSAFTFGQRTGVGAYVIGDTGLKATGDALGLLFAPIRLLANSITNWSPDLVTGLRSVKHGASVQHDYYANGPFKGVGAKLNEASHKVYLRFNKSRFYKQQ